LEPIEELEVRHVLMPLTQPYKTSSGEERAIGAVFVRARTNRTEVWAETTPQSLPRYSPDWAGGVFALVVRLAPDVLAGQLESPADLSVRLDPYKGNLFAKAAFDVAAWTLAAAEAGVPLHRMLGARSDVAAVGASCGITENLDALWAKIDEAISTGCTRVKLKVAPGHDIAFLAAVRERFPTTAFHVDCNAAYSLNDLDTLRKFDRFGLEMIEQPLAHDDLVHHARLQSEILTPICLDESIMSPAQARLAVELGSCKVINVKPGRVGGLSAAMEIMAICRDAGLGVWVGGMLESGLGRAVAAALACVGCTYPSDIIPSSTRYAQALVRPGLTFERDPVLGRVVRPTTGPGVSQELDVELLDAWTIERATISLG
jgi:o-succinylbenzoate synthase